MPKLKAKVSARCATLRFVKYLEVSGQSYSGCVACWRVHGTMLQLRCSTVALTTWYLPPSLFALINL